VLAQIGKRVTPFLSAPLTIIPFAVHLFIYGPFPEELGWGGYVLDGCKQGGMRWCQV
jgi:membrane protease YdiL (CAAX protease family)